MDISQFVTQENADEGVWTPIIINGTPMDIDLKILGDDSDVVQKYQRKQIKKMKGLVSNLKDNKTEIDDDTIDEIFESNNEAVIIRIAGIRGWKVERKGTKEISREPVNAITIKDRAGVEKEIKNDHESYEYLVTKIPAIKEIVLKVAGDRNNFLLKPSGN